MTFKLSSGVGPVWASLSHRPLTPDPTLGASLITHKASECGRIIPAGWLGTPLLRPGDLSGFTGHPHLNLGH